MTLFEAAQMVDCGELLQKVGMEGHLIGNGRGVWRCPFHEDQAISLVTFSSIRHWKSIFYCFGCKRYGSAIELYQKINGFQSPREAAKALCTKFDIPYEKPTPRGVKELKYNADEDPRLVGIRKICSEWRTFRLDWCAILIAGSREVIGATMPGLEKSKEEQCLVYYEQQLKNYQTMSEWEMLNDIRKEFEILGITPCRRLRISGFVT